MKRTGFDHIVFTGKAEQPVYLWIDDGRTEIRPAPHLWGKSTAETEEAIRSELGDAGVKVASIGPGGENLVKYASVMFDSSHAAGRTGIGAVMGSKNLKALAVRGRKGVRVARPEAFMRFVRDLYGRVVNNPGYKDLATYGSSYLTKGADANGLQSYRNAQTNIWPGIRGLDHRLLKREYYVKSLACTACPRHCNQAWVVKEGKYAGTQSSKIEYAAIAVFGCGCLIDDFGDVGKLTWLCDEYGLDVIETGITLNAALEWYEKGLITSRDTGGIELDWGNTAAIAAMIDQIARREGFGSLLAEGALGAARQIGPGAEKSITVYAKGMSMCPADLRPLKSYALSQATSTRGACHLRGGGRKKGLPASEVAAMTVYGQDLCTLVDCFELCKFNTGYSSIEIDIQTLAELFTLATGVEMDEKTLQAAASRIYNVERAYAVRQGLTRADDLLYGRWGEEPVPDGPFKGFRIDPADFNRLLDEYYALRGWDQSGIPSNSTLSALGLEDVARELEILYSA
jgi:aldehyde:ferredoxin oxidoreductase